jgi:hypothetical protein
MAWKWCVAGCLILAGALAGCSGYMFAEREAWRRDAELQCLQARAAREGGGIVQMDAIQGPGVCGADFPLKVSVLAESVALGFAPELRSNTGAIRSSYAAPEPKAAFDRPRPVRSPATSAVPVTVTPAATLACPMVSQLEHWIATAVQPASMRWFGMPVTEIRQISAYSCRGMNGNRFARISEHAFGNALDIASFTLADGRTVRVRDGWRGLPEEQGFLRDVQGAACDQFTTVLAPGSNIYHYDHIHVDLMRRHSDRRACNPQAVSGEIVAARAAGSKYSARPRGEPAVTGTVAPRRAPLRQRARPDPYDDHRFPTLPLAEAGNDGAD